MIVITGKVQGVGFRAFLEKTANGLGLCGYVRNRDRNKVVTMVCGDKELVDYYISACKSGPKSAIVENIEVSEAKNEKFKGFSIWL